jgi:hypothetical protein
VPPIGRRVLPKLELKEGIPEEFATYTAMVELTDNLMIIHGLDLHGHPLILPAQPVADPLRDLSAFETCVRIAAPHKRA